MLQIKSVLTTIFTKIKKRWKLSLFVIILLLLGGYYVYQAQAANQPEYIFENPQVRDLKKTLDISGYVDAKEKVRMRFIAGGKLTYVGAEVGDTVKKWQTIARIDAATLQKQLDQDLNNYLKERWDFEETRDNSQDYNLLELSERRNLDKDQFDLENTVSTVEIRDIAIQNTALYSPFEGILTQAPTSTAGMQVLASDYFEIVNPESLVFIAAVDESDISQVSEGQSAELILDSYEDSTINTTVQYISFTSTESNSGTSFVVEFPLNAEITDQMLRIGMNGDINILLEEKQSVLAIPVIALIQRDGSYFVQIKSGEDQVADREITIGLETDDYVEVLSGLTESDEIVIPE